MLRIVAWLSFRARTIADEIAFHQRNSAAFHGHVRPRSHGDANIGLSKRRGVVDAISGHGDDASFFLQTLYDFSLLLRLHPGLKLLDSQRASRRLRGALAVSG